MKAIQTAFIQQLLNWLNQDELRSLLIRTKHKNLAETSFDLLVRWYPQIAEDGRDSYGLSIIGRLEHAEVTERAGKALRAMCADTETTSKDLLQALRKAAHYEHNAPVDVIKKRLLALEHPNQEKVKVVLEDGYTIVLVSKEEEAVLNGKNQKRYTLDGQDCIGAGLSSTGDAQSRLIAIGAKVLSNSEKEALIKDIKNRLKAGKKS